MTRSAPLGLLRAEFAILLTLCFVLPILEAPKSLALALLLIMLLLRLVVFERPALRAPDLTEALLVLLIAASLLSTVLNWPIANGFKGAKDTFSSAAMCWYMYRTPHSRRELYRIAQWLTAGILVGLIWGAVEVLAGWRPNLEFHSAGIVTQSAIYLLIGLTLAFGLACVCRRREIYEVDPERRAAPRWALAAGVMLVSLVLMGSRGALLAAIVLALLLLLVLGSARLVSVVLLGFAVALGVGLMLPNTFSQERLFAKTEGLAGKTLPAADLERATMWRIGAAQFAQTEHKLFGIGPRNFKSIRVDRLHFDRPIALPNHELPHAHNLFLNVLVEEGVIGFAALAGFFLLVALRLFADWRNGCWFDWPWFGAVGALGAPVIAGSFNAPFYQEHAVFAMLLFGLYFYTRRQVAALPSARAGVLL